MSSNVSDEDIEFREVMYSKTFLKKIQMKIKVGFSVLLQTAQNWP